MSRLKICELSSCETINASQIYGGLSSESTVVQDKSSESTVDLLDLLNYIPILKKTSSEEKDGFLDEEYRDESGNHYVRRLLSKDGKRQFYSAIGNINGVSYAVSSSQITNI